MDFRMVVGFKSNTNLRYIYEAKCQVDYKLLLFKESLTVVRGAEF